MLSNKPSLPSPNPSDLAELAMLEPAFVARHAKALDKIALFADLSEGFTVGIVEVDLERDRTLAIQALTHRADTAHIQWVLLHLDQPDLRYLLDAITTALKQVPLVPEKKPVLLLTGLERAIGGYGDHPPLLSNFNFARDTYARQLPYPVLFWLPSYAVTRFAQFAPDVWAWKSMEVRLPSDLPPPDQALSALVPIANTQRLLPVAPERFDLLHRLLQEYRSPSPSRADLLHQLGQAYKSHLDYPRAEQAYQEALQLYQTLGNNLGVAKASNNLAELYRALGRYAEAEPRYVRSLEILLQVLGQDHPSTQTVRNNFRTCLQAAVVAGQAGELSDHPLTQAMLAQLAGDGGATDA
ncbi:MAG: tetratricopeptide repeat protein [Cyanobacteria bacterium]|nr:tetratricopeptide repeat protein [Cyanobacteriota bacterium]MDW8200822.1 tetratricopeptide repeat protein [Cyanobacteriota bacterium SKYGB_h_bin112]